MIADAFRRPTWAFCSRPVSLVASRELWFAPRDIPRRASSVDEFEALVFGEVDIVLDVERREGRSRAMQQAAIQESLIGRGRPRSRAWAWISPQTVAAWKLQGRTTTLAKKARRPARRWVPSGAGRSTGSARRR